MPDPTFTPIRSALADAYLGDTKLARSMFSSDPTLFDQRLLSLLSGLGQGVPSPLPSAISGDDLKAAMAALDPADNGRRIQILSMLAGAYSAGALYLPCYLNHSIVLHGFTAAGADVAPSDDEIIQYMSFTVSRLNGFSRGSLPNNLVQVPTYFFSAHIELPALSLLGGSVHVWNPVCIKVPFSAFPDDFFGSSDGYLDSLFPPHPHGRRILRPAVLSYPASGSMSGNILPVRVYRHFDLSVPFLYFSFPENWSVAFANTDVGDGETGRVYLDFDFSLSASSILA